MEGLPAVRLVVLFVSSTLAASGATDANALLIVLPVAASISPLLSPLLLLLLLLLQMMDEYAGKVRDFPHPSKQQMENVFAMCRSDQWMAVYDNALGNPWVAMTPMIMDNHISTTILHQAITSKGDTAARAKVILLILEKTPMAAAIKNGYGSLPLHVIAQRNTKMDARTKEMLIFQLIGAFKGALTEEGGVGKRTPLHIIFTGTFLLFHE